MINQQVPLELFNSVISDLPSNPKLLPELGVFASVPSSLVNEVETYFNNKLSFKELNNGFYKNWSQVKNTSDKERLLDQILHYFTVSFTPGLVYLPESYSINKGRTSINCVGTLSTTEVITRCETLLNSPSIKTETITLIFNLLKELNYSFENNFSNKEAQCLVWDYRDTLPTNREELFRYLFYKATTTTLVVNNKDNISLISSSNYSIPPLSKTQEINLSKRFLPLKELWVAGFKKAHKDNIPLVNRLNKLSKAYHSPKTTPILLQVTSSPNLHKDELEEAARTCTTPNLIKAINALRVYYIGNNNKLYRIRNGKSYVKTKEANPDLVTYLSYTTTLTNVLKERLTNKTYFQKEDYISYSTNLSSKQMVGKVPSGTRISFNTTTNLYIGIHWVNPVNERMDLDLRADSINSSVGWNSSYSNEGLSYSGDITDAPLPLGASEWFNVNNKLKADYLLKVNNFTGQATFKFKLVIGYGKSNTKSLIQLDNIIFETEIESNQREFTLGLLTSDNHFYLLGSNSGNKSVGKHSNAALEATITSLKYSLRLEDILTKTEREGIDLSLDKLTVDSFINLI